MKVLIVDDQRSARHVLRKMLADVPDLVLDEAPSAEKALHACKQSCPDLVLLDIRLTDDPRDRSGLDVLRNLREGGNRVPVVMVTSLTEVGEVRTALKWGAQDYIFKDELALTRLLPILDVYRVRKTQRDDTSFAKQNENQGLSALVGSSQAMGRLRRTIVRVADAEATVLIRGETGTGKELVGRALHQLSSRRDEPFVAVNCSALPGTLMESLIFGHEKGAFTGADRRARGHFELARSGTVLLDEIAEMPGELQAKLLRVLEDRRFRPLGSETELPLRARVLASTHVDLEERIREGKFRKDLYYRLELLTFRIPPLADRTDDIPELLATFLAQCERRLRFTDEAIAWLGRRPWPGNIRELKNLVARVALLSSSELVGLEELEELSGEAVCGNEGELDRIARALLSLPDELGPKLSLIEKAVVEEAIRSCRGNKSAAARMIGIDRKALERRCRLTDLDDDLN